METPYRVRYRHLHGFRPVRSSLLVVAALLLVGGFFVWLMWPSHWPSDTRGSVVYAASLAVTATTGIIGWFAFLNVATLCRATLLARDPVPVPPEPGRRVAFLTTIVPSAEPPELVRPTLEAALRVDYAGPIDAWLLDEGDDDAVTRMCAELGVRHFSRRGIERWNQPTGRFRAKSKHGNYNAWLDAHGDEYDFFLGVDPDHVPLPNFAERLLGYFRDPDVAFVVGPQVYGNYEGFVVRAAESQQFLFHSLLQRAGNRSRTPMLVGTNNAVRIRALQEIGGLQDSITEDMATSLAFHTSRNPQTGRRWTSVYTPDVLAVGEGPTSFTDYFSQQDRWSRGTNEILATRFWRLAHRLSPRRLMHYSLLTAYYPSAAIAWILGALNGALYFMLGAGGVEVSAQLWLMLYLDAAALQVGLYFYNRRHNVSPHEKEGSSGLAGMLISALSAPVYVSAIAGALRRRRGAFVTTPKGDATNADGLATFRKHLQWAAIFGVPLALSFLLGRRAGPEEARPGEARPDAAGAARARFAGCRGVSRRARQRVVKAVIALLAVCGLAAINGPPLVSAGREALHEYRINSSGYKERAGHWSILPVPEGLRVNAIHAALLRTGKVLIIAGSGNDEKRFDAGKFDSLLWDPATDEFERIHTPSDMFCAGHAFLPDGRLLIAGGTKRYEVLEKHVKRAGGALTIKNESPDGGPLRLEKGARVVSPGGTAFRTTRSVVVEPARKRVAPNGKTTVTASATDVWVEAVTPGRAAAIESPTQFRIPAAGRKGADDVYGLAPSLTMAKREYWGDDKSYIFDPETERYQRIDNLTLARWYPTLVGLRDGRVLSVSGLDNFGRFIDGHNEIYDPATNRWDPRPRLRRTFPTYPALFLMPSGNLFYSGSNAGYGSATVGRDPGIWDLTDNSFEKVPGLRDPDQTETSGSVMLPPAQDQRYMIAGGGGVGESKKSTARTDVIELDDPAPSFTPGPDLERPVRYPGMVITPDDKVVITGGSSDYRGEGGSDQLVCQLYDPRTNRISRMADPRVARSYHSEALLLPDGRVVTLGGDPLYRDAENTLPGKFEQRIEIYSPPYLYRGERPRITSGPEQLRRGTTARFASPDAAGVRTARLMRPGASTHVTDVEQRSVALSVTKQPGAIEVGIPEAAGLLPSGWYMLFVTGEDDAPSDARWVRVE